MRRTAAKSLVHVPEEVTQEEGGPARGTSRSPRGLVGSLLRRAAGWRTQGWGRSAVGEGGGDCSDCPWR